MMYLAALFSLNYMKELDPNMLADVEIINNLSISSVLLENVCKITGMGFAAIARVTPEKWVACGVRDEIKFGLMPGGELQVDTTICHEIRQGGNEVVIDDVDKDEFYRSHHTPAMYGFQSYISLPIARQDGSFFGTLCAIDPSPAVLRNPEIMGMFKVYAALISFHFNAAEQLSPEHAKLLEDRTNAALKDQLKQIMAQGSPRPGPRNQQFVQAILQSSAQLKDLLEELKKAAAEL